jgi:hypothetical protein
LVASFSDKKVVGVRFSCAATIHYRFGPLTLPVQRSGLSG